MGLPGANRPPVRTFDTGATRDTSEGKVEYEGYLSSRVLRRFGEYMLKHQYQSDGQIRDADNWQKGIPRDAYMDSGFRHFMDWWSYHRKTGPVLTYDQREEILCAVMFNAMGYLHECLEERARDGHG